jgi:hypothetical protein
MKIDGRRFSWFELRTPLLVMMTWVAFGVLGGIAATTTVDWLSSVLLLLSFIVLFSPLLYLSVKTISTNPLHDRGEWALPAFAAGAFAVAIFRLLVDDIVMAITFVLISGFLLIVWLLRQQQL